MSETSDKRELRAMAFEGCPDSYWNICPRYQSSDKECVDICIFSTGPFTRPVPSSLCQMPKVPEPDWNDGTYDHGSLVAFVAALREQVK